MKFVKASKEPLTVGHLRPGDEFEVGPGEAYRLVYNVQPMRAYVQPLTKVHVVVKDPKTGAIKQQFDKFEDKTNISCGTLVSRVIRRAEQ